MISLIPLSLTMISLSMRSRIHLINVFEYLSLGNLRASPFVFYNNCFHEVLTILHSL